MDQKRYDTMLSKMYKFTVPLIRPHQVMEYINSGKKVQFFDIRSEKEYMVSHIPDSLFFNYDEFDASDIKNISKEEMIVVYCSVGYRSEKAGQQLLSAGFKNVFNMYGGVFQWIYEDYKLVDNSGKTTENVHTYNKKWSQWLMKGKKIYE